MTLDIRFQCTPHTVPVALQSFTWGGGLTWEEGAVLAVRVLCLMENSVEPDITQMWSTVRESAPAFPFTVLCQALLLPTGAFPDKAVRAQVVMQGLCGGEGEELEAG